MVRYIGKTILPLDNANIEGFAIDFQTFYTLGKSSI